MVVIIKGNQMNPGNAYLEEQLSPPSLALEGGLLIAFNKVYSMHFNDSDDGIPFVKTLTLSDLKQVLVTERYSSKSANQKLEK